ncbi:YbaB/EbfC DNA-binding family protein [Micromonospora nigra]|uniref:YbaB/EbfC DNA-binding family protein n=1 Tax=Micromonospora nigra TaxID=145857 RepID=A0A1C6T4K0_9ACTN|nr:YbaB/EbfC family nucleoid-associated protein [Micromonospora nigra]SCL36740.1 YbaB/EbfC DNA-binding family protein [Micromonospora nigra]
MWADQAALDAATQGLDEWEASFADQAVRAKALSAQVQSLNGTASSPDRAVEVTVDSSGLLVDLRLDETVRQRSAAHTARVIVETTRAAHTDLLRQVSATAAAVGGGDPAGQAIVDTYRHRLNADETPPDIPR